ncbi:MAG TPA: mechanosensitive ion channel family protein [Pseudonocardiaceae bacterium]|nr:mechanosensitive ion channel family protein [Pseudonocardiaceae bacterium]
MAFLRLWRPRRVDGQTGRGAPGPIEVLEAGLRPDFRRALLAGTLALATLAVGSNLGGLHAPELHTKLVVIGLAVVFAFLGLVTARSTANQVARAASHASSSAASTTKVLCLLVGYLVVFLGTLGLLTIPLQQLLVGGALTGVIVGIAAQQPLSNLFAGLVLLLARPIAVGQWVCIHSGALGGPLEGSVVEMGLIYTTFSTEHEILHIPNSGLLNAALRAPTTPHSPPANQDESRPIGE